MEPMDPTLSTPLTSSIGANTVAERSTAMAICGNLARLSVHPEGDHECRNMESLA
jgi:hypothetical protein